MSRKREGSRKQRRAARKESTGGAAPSSGSPEAPGAEASGGAEPAGSADAPAASEAASGSGPAARWPSAAGVLGRWQTWATALGVVAGVALVGWLLSLPLQLQAAEGYGERGARRAVAKELHLGSNGAEREQAIDEWVKEHPAEFAEKRLALTTEARDSGSFEDPKWGAVAYPGGYDGYLWMRHARNLLEKGTVCDAVVDGECWDTKTLAPVGSPMVYARSVHIVAIAVVHAVLGKLLSMPLELSAQWVSILFGALAVVPAFFLGRRLAGPLGGLLGAVFALGNAATVSRVAQPDNDVWNVLLPLVMAASLLAALERERLRSRLGFTAAAGVVAAIQLASWRGGIFAQVVVLAALGAALSWAALRALKTGERRFWRAPEVRDLGLVLGVYLGVSTVVLLLLGGGSGYSVLASTLSRPFVASTKGPPGLSMPTGLGTVAEMVSLSWERTVDRLGQGAFVFAAGLGSTLMFLPRGPWQRTNALPLVGGLLFAAVLHLMDEPTKVEVLVLTFAPALGALLSRAFAEPAKMGSVAAPALLWVWAVLGTRQMLDANRFEILAAPALGLAAMAGVDRVAGWLRAASADWKGERFGVSVGAVCLLGGAAMISRPVTYAHEIARNQFPRLSDAWHDTFIDIRDQSREDAIINLWWDQGHWAKYYSERRVSADGGTLRTQVHHWFARALLAKDEAETVGILRMLDCGSDATPLEGAERGAFGKLRLYGLEPTRAYATIVALVNAPRPRAERILSDAGLDAAQVEAVLASTHCDPPQGFLALDGFTITQATLWTGLAAWRPGEADPVAASFANSGLLYCSTTPDGLRCGIGAPFLGKFLQGFTYDSRSPMQSEVHYLRTKGGEAIAEGPELLLVANNGQVVELPNLGVTNGIAVLVDPSRRAIVVGGKELIQSTFTRLMFLGDEYTPHFQNLAERSDQQRSRVVSWRILW